MNRVHLDPYGFIVFLVGTLVLLEVFLRNIPGQLEAIIPFIPEGASHRALFLIGILLLYLSEQVSRRKRSAWLTVVLLLGSLIVVSLTRHFAWPNLLGYIAVLALFVAEQKSFIARSDTISLRRGLTLAIMQIVGAMLIVGMIFAILDQHEFGHHLNTGQTFRLTLDALAGNPLPTYAEPTRYDDALIDMLRYTGLVTGLSLIWSLFRPLQLKGSSSRISRHTTQGILQRHSESSEDYFKLFPHDKHYFFYGDGAIAYAVRAGTAIVLQGVTGPPREQETLRDAFIEHCRRNGWRAAILHCEAAEAEAWAPKGFERLQIGSEAIIDSAIFITKTTHSKHFRYIQNRAAKDALRVTWWQPPLSETQLCALKQVSDAWVTNGRQEYAFVMAPFSEEYLRSCKVAVLTANDKVIAYANLVPTYNDVQVATIDHMRSLPGISSAAMHFLLWQCIDKTYQEGYPHFNLGLVPLAKLETNSPKITERLLIALRRVSGRFYSSQGLEQFKNKFEPEWSPRYLAYQGGIRQLPLIATAILQLTSNRKAKKLYWSWPVVLIGLSAFLYASFPLAMLLNPPYAWHDLVSKLGSTGQPYAWFFNGADVISSIFAICVLGWIFRTRRPHTEKLHLALGLAIAASLGALIAALVAIPETTSSTAGHFDIALLESPGFITHGIASFVNSSAFVVAAVLWAMHWRKLRKWNWRVIITLTIVLISTIGFVIGQLLPSTSGILQRAFILLYAVWFVAFTRDLLKLRHHHK